MIHNDSNDPHQAANSPYAQIIVTPTPTDDERDALTAVLAIVFSTTNAPPEQSHPTLSRWVMTGRRAARNRNGQMGWGRERGQDG